MCRGRISLQYPLVEAITAILFALLGFWVASAPFGVPWFGIILVIFYLAILALLVCIAVYDMFHTMIPDEWAYAFAGLAFISQFLLPFSGEFDPWWFIFAGPAAAAPLFALWLFSGGRWMGLGDAKLALGIGWLLGPALGLFAVFAAFVIGAFVSVPLLSFSSPVWEKFSEWFIQHHSWRMSGAGFTMKSEIPFGPFLILSCITLWFTTLYGIDPLQTLEGLLLSSSWQ